MLSALQGVVGKIHRCSGPGENGETIFSEKGILHWERGGKVSSKLQTPDLGSGLAAVGSSAWAGEGKVSPDRGEGAQHQLSKPEHRGPWPLLR